MHRLGIQTRQAKAFRDAGNPRRDSSRKENLEDGGSKSRRDELSLRRYIGGRIGTHRKRIALTLSALAEAAQISFSRLSKIERGDSFPSLPLLRRIARALNQPLAEFIPASQTKYDCSYVKSGGGLLIERKGVEAGYQTCQLGSSIIDEYAVDVSIVTLLESANLPLSAPRIASTFIHMLGGKLVYRRANQTYSLEAGDTLLFDAISPHGPEKLSKAPASYLSIAVYPREA